MAFAVKSQSSKHPSYGRDQHPKVSYKIMDSPFCTKCEIHGLLLSVSVTPNLSSGQFWIIDSGASSHICCNANSFTSMSRIHNAYVTLPDRTTISINCIGDVHLSSQLTLHKVLYVPQFRFNLLFVSALTTDSSLAVHFYHDHFVIQEANSSRIGRGNRIGDLYILNLQQLGSDSVSFVNKVSVELWHQRLGHPSSKVLTSLRDRLAYDVPNNSPLIPCLICPLAKQIIICLHVLLT